MGYIVYVLAEREDNEKSTEKGVTTMTDDELRREAARLLGSIKSERKAASSRENGKKGGRPRKKQTPKDIDI